MKKLFLLIVAITIFAVPVFAEENWNGNRQMAVTVSVRAVLIDNVGFDVNLGFEYAPIPNASVTAGFGYTFTTGQSYRNNAGGIKILEQSKYHIRLGGRWYPQESYISGYFLGGSLQFMNNSIAVSKLDKKGDRIRAGGWREIFFSIFADTGYKAIVGSDKRAAFAIEPTLSFGVPLAALGSVHYDLRDDYWENIWSGREDGSSGLFLRLPIGIAF